MLFSEPKIPQFTNDQIAEHRYYGFSALQRAENSSIERANVTPNLHAISFSALQRAENSSISRAVRVVVPPGRVSVLFSEPKIPQFYTRCCDTFAARRVSVLFSEPKIPQ